MVVEALLSLGHTLDIEGIMQMARFVLASRTEFVFGLEPWFLSGVGVNPLGNLSHLLVGGRPKQIILLK